MQLGVFIRHVALATSLLSAACVGTGPQPTEPPVVSATRPKAQPAASAAPTATPPLSVATCKDLRLPPGGCAHVDVRSVIEDCVVVWETLRPELAASYTERLTGHLGGVRMCDPNLLRSWLGQRVYQLTVEPGEHPSCVERACEPDQKPSLVREGCQSAHAAVLPSKHSSLGSCLHETCDPIQCILEVMHLEPGQRYPSQPQPPPRAPAAKAAAQLRGRAMMSAPEVTGGSVANATSVVARLRGRIRGCYVAAFDQEPKPPKQAALTLHLKVDKAGSVSALSVDGQDPTLHDAVRCMATKIKQQAVFAPPAGGNATVSFEVRLQLRD